MRQVSRRTANYSADLFGICSALYELGGLIVMHDASGCNSTYATHDEPRWYDMDSMVYISGLEEYDAVLGNDQKLIDDICECANEKHPKFIAVFGSPIALMTGTDFKGIARVIEDETGIPTFGFKTSGMYTYIEGARQALAAIAERFCPPAADVPVQNADPLSEPGSEREVHYWKKPVRVNLLGVTPLDFSVVGNVEALQRFCTDNSFEVVSCWAMGCTLEQLALAGRADVNLVCSSMALDCAEVLKKKYGTPYVVGLPVGSLAEQKLAKCIRKSAEDKKDRRMAAPNPLDLLQAADADESPENQAARRLPACTGTLLIGEPVFTTSLRWALEHATSTGPVHIICPTEEPAGLLRRSDLLSDDESDITAWMNAAQTVIADPLYERVLDSDSLTRFIRFPSESYSGRMFRSEIPVFVGPSFDRWLEANYPGRL